LEKKTKELEPLLDKIKFLEPQHAMVILRHCTTSKFNHLWRTVPSKLAQTAARRVQDSIISILWDTTCEILNIPKDEDSRKEYEMNLDRAKKHFFFPLELGGIGLVDPVRTTRPAFIGGWSSALHELMEAGSPGFKWWCDHLLAKERLMRAGDLSIGNAPCDIGHVTHGLVEDLRLVGEQIKALLERKRDAPRPITEEQLATIPTTAERLCAAVTDGRVRKLQNVIYQVVCQLDWCKVWSAQTVKIRALMRAKTAQGCHSHLTAMPGHKLLYAAPEEMIFLVRNILFLPLSNINIPPHWIPEGGGGGGGDPPENYLRCHKLMLAAHHSPTHTSMLAVLRAMLESVGITYRPEQSYTMRDERGVKGRGDFSENRLATNIGMTTLYDFSGVNPATDEAVDGAQNSVGYAALMVEKKKVEENSDRCKRENWMFCPVGMEETGCFGNGMQNLIKKCNDIASRYPESVPMCENWATRTFKDFWSQALRFTMCKALHIRWLGVLEQRLAAL
jgi:hypothetical protein